MPEAELKSGNGNARPIVRASTVIAPVELTLAAFLIAAMTSLSTTFSARPTAIESAPPEPVPETAAATAAAPAVATIRDESVAVTEMLPAEIPAPVPSIKPSTVVAIRLVVCEPAPLRPTAFFPADSATVALTTVAAID